MNSSRAPHAVFRTAAAKLRCPKTAHPAAEFEDFYAPRITDPDPPQEMMSEAEMKRAARNVFKARARDEPHKSRKYFGSLVLAVRDKSNKRWVYAGHVGTGFDQAAPKSMQPPRTDKRPFDQKVKQENATTWLVPKLVSEVKFTEWTSEGEMRHPVFLGLRRQKGQRRHPRTSMRGFRWKLGLIILKPQNHTSSIRAPGVHFAMSPLP